MTKYFAPPPAPAILRTLLLLGLAGVTSLEPAWCAGIDSETCLECHSDSAKTKTPVDTRIINKSAHTDLECIDCHESVTSREHPASLPKVNCAGCHEDQQREFEGSVHALAKVSDLRFQPSCSTCHGTHAILGKKRPDSTINPRNIAKTCGHCHSQPEIMQIFGRRGVDPVAHYERSVHGRRLQEKLAENPIPSRLPATCVDCHGGHGIFSRLNPKSSFSKFTIAKTCSKCHQKPAQEYMQSVHWQSVSQRGNYESPACYDCHGEHDVAKPGLEAAGGGDSDKLASTRLCANCHANSVLMARFGLDANRFSSYMTTYHGLAVLRGSPDAAACISCHSVHAVRSKSDPLSPVHSDNLVKTCGNCHTVTNADFVKVSVHPLNQKERNPLAYLFRKMYVWLIVLTIGGMLVHNLIIMAYYLKRRWDSQQEQKLICRFNHFDVIQHFLLLISFSVLALTGFALTFPDTLWAQALSALGLTEAGRALLHRCAAMLLLASGLMQMIYFVFIRRGRREVLALIPRFWDVRGFVQNMGNHLGLRSEPPKFGRYDYAEKAEYLALLWGGIVMAVTGLILWFPETSLSFLPVWAFEVAEVIHFYEAVLALGAAIVWHLFFTILHPEKYPMSFTWLHGKIDEESQRHHHPLEEIDPPDK
jgi:formate dehydrogenase gamma subunit